MYDYIASLFLPHKWTVGAGRRCCPSCGRVELFEEWEDGIAGFQSRWAVETPGDRLRHLTSYRLRMARSRTQK